MSAQPEYTAEDRKSRPELVHRSSPPTRRGKGWVWVVIGFVVLAAIGIIGYFVLYNGTGGYSGGSSGGGGSGGGYFILALSAEHFRRVITRLRSDPAH